jgi:hypothetical protein
LAPITRKAVILNSADKIKDIIGMERTVVKPENYEIWVTIGELNEIPYALAWWAGTDERPDPGDFNSDGSVNAADYVMWRKFHSSNEGYADWRANFEGAAGSGNSALVPEPNGLIIFAVVCLFSKCRRGNS